MGAAMTAPVEDIRLVTKEIHPQPKQEQFLTARADIVIYGGAAGGGKTWAMLLDPLRYIGVPGFGATLFRRTYPEITNQGGLWDESQDIYPHAGGTPVQGDLTWHFPPGTRVEFRHLQHEKDLIKYDGAQITWLGFDQLEHFSERQFFYLLMRNRSTCAVRPRCRATCNPDPDSFLASFLSWWIADDGYADMSRAGAVRWFVRENERLVWADDPAELTALYPESEPLSVAFIPATVFDNKQLLIHNPRYLARLRGLPLVERERFLGDAMRGGNWKVKPEAGKVFNRTWFDVVNDAPTGGIDCRAFDFAGAMQITGDDPDYIGSVKMRKASDGEYYVLDFWMERWPAGEIDKLVLSTARQDRMASTADQAEYCVRWEIEPGSAAQRDAVRQMRNLNGFDAQGVLTGGRIS